MKVINFSGFGENYAICTMNISTSLTVDSEMNITNVCLMQRRNQDEASEYLGEKESVLCEQQA